MTKAKPHSIQQRLEHQIHLLLLEMEEKPELIAFKERLAVITTLGMYLTRALKLDDAADPGGATVRKYAGAFKTNVARRGKANTGPGSFDLSYDDDTATN